MDVEELVRLGLFADLGRLDDPKLTDDEWWDRNAAAWALDPTYLENLEGKAAKHGRAWVRSNIRMLHAYWKNWRQLDAGL